MIKSLAILNLLIVISCTANSSDKKVVKNKQIVVAVIDTGIDEALMKKNFMCDKGHRDFTGTGLKDRHGHGTHISGIIDQYAKNFIFLTKSGKVPSKIDEVAVDYCQIILKYIDPTAEYNDNLKSTIKAFRWAIDSKVDIINYSGGGTEFSQEEHDVVMEALNKGIKVVAAAGNERSDIDKHKYYPAMYDSRIFIVANLVDNKVEKTVTKSVGLHGAIITTETVKRNIAATSNYGVSINTYEIGTNIFSRLPNQTFGFMTGTSQATAVKSGKLVREMLLNR